MVLNVSSRPEAWTRRGGLLRNNPTRKGVPRSWYADAFGGRNAEKAGRARKKQVMGKKKRLKQDASMATVAVLMSPLVYAMAYVIMHTLR
jgi:hypothetical protein